VPCSITEATDSAGNLRIRQVRAAIHSVCFGGIFA